MTAPSRPRQLQQRQVATAGKGPEFLPDPRGLKAGLGWIRSSGENADGRTGPAGTWTYAHRKGLRISAVAVAAVVFVFWSQPTGMVALIIAIILLAVLGLIELLGRPPASTAARRTWGVALPARLGSEDSAATGTYPA